MPARRLLSLIVMFALALPTAAGAARPVDRDRDKLPDRWEKRYGLSTKKKDAKRDRDRDGLTNLAEYRAKTNPRKADTDGDGLKDGRDPNPLVAQADDEDDSLMDDEFDSFLEDALGGSDDGLDGGDDDAPGADDDFPGDE